MTVPIENILPDIINAIVDPFTNLMGAWFWATILVLIVGAVYIKTESYGPPLAVMMVMSVLLTAVVPTDVKYFFAVLSALSVAGMLYGAYTRRR